MAFDKAGIDITNVIRGASTKPFAFMAHYPGAGVGGHCIPVDPYYLIRYGAENGFEHRFLATARRINERMPAYTVKLAEDALKEKGRALAGSTIALLGLAYKKDVPDMRESPALVIEKILKERGACVRAYDPYAPRIAGEHSVEDALDGADAAIVATDHSLFLDLSPEDFARKGVSIVIDGRNCLDKSAFADSGVLYRGIGRRV
jgi:UDP-N-acetyl-D-glucosamine dehydrogenase